MIKGSLATTYVVNFAPLPVMITSIRDVGDGQSLQVNWVPGDLARLDHYMLHWTTVPASQPESLLVAADSSSYIIEPLMEGQQYRFHLIAYDTDGRSSIAFDVALGTPQSIPSAPDGLTASPLVAGIKLDWQTNNIELDFDYYSIIRDGAILVDSIFDTTYTDTDPSLGSDLHEYLVRAVDIDGNRSDTAGISPVVMKAATLQDGRILAINRSGNNAQALVDEIVTGEFMREALDVWSFDYYSDTASENPDRANLLNMVDYSLVIIGAESGRQDDLYNALDNVLGDLSKYLSIGGKAIIFGRWGDISLSMETDTVYFSPILSNFVYTDYFHIAFRIRPLTYINQQPLLLESDFVGAQSQVPGYPTLVWDSMATVNHTGGSYTGLSGIPCPTIPFLTGSQIEPVYTYVSAVDSPLTHNKPIAWRYLESDYQYVYFELPLSFMNRPAAVAALRKAITDLGIPTSADDENTGEPIPQRFSLSQNYPNPFNPKTTIEFYNPESRPAKVSLDLFNILGQRVRSLLDGYADPGTNRLEWDGRDEEDKPVATGIYFYRLKMENETLTRKMILLK
jgi:hypothetical protein